MELSVRRRYIVYCAFIATISLVRNVPKRINFYQSSFRIRLHLKNHVSFSIQFIMPGMVSTANWVRSSDCLVASLWTAPHYLRDIIWKRERKHTTAPSASVEEKNWPTKCYNRGRMKSIKPKQAEGGKKKGEEKIEKFCANILTHFLIKHIRKVFSFFLMSSSSRRIRRARGKVFDRLFFPSTCGCSFESRKLIHHRCGRCSRVK